MRRHTAFLSIAIAMSPAVLPAEGLVPTIGSDFEFCQDRPVEPEWMTELPSRESYKRFVIQTIYRAQGVERVVEAQNCSCETRFPTWDTAVQRFNDNYLGGDRNALREAEEEHFDRYNELRPAARALCEPAGNW